MDIVKKTTDSTMVGAILLIPIARQMALVLTVWNIVSAPVISLDQPVGKSWTHATTCAKTVFVALPQPAPSGLAAEHSKCPLNRVVLTLTKYPISILICPLRRPVLFLISLMTMMTFIGGLGPFVNATMGTLERTVHARLVVLAIVPMEQHALSFQPVKPLLLEMTTFATVPLLPWVLVLMIPLILAVSATVLFIMNASMINRGTLTKIGNVLTMVVVSTALRVLNAAATMAG
mmetsp:Transcript_8460/g.20361  ORF Transcript_8460/g.20361 Transcript_8460/m.20361 type:complete len:233 (+) Transcript_8460:2255-2953(+)